MTSTALASRFFLLASVLAIAIGCLPAAAQAQESVVLKKSDRLSRVVTDYADPLAETFGDWTLRCAKTGAARSCLIGQIKADAETGQRIFVMELHPPKDGVTNGVLLMPVGLDLAEGARLRIDGRNLGRPVSFESCLPNGCIIRLTLPEIATSAMREANELGVLSTYAGDAEPTAFTVSLDGLGAALDRFDQIAE